MELTHSQQDVEAKVLTLIRDFLNDLGNERALRAVSASAYLDKDLGLGSLERVELMLRLEQGFAIRLPEGALFTAETISDVVTAILQSKPSQIVISHDKLPTTLLKQIATTPDTALNLRDVLFNYAHIEPRRPHIYLQADNGEEECITYGELLEAATRCAVGLWDYGLKQGDTVALMLPTSKDFFFAFFGVILAGGIPVPIYPPLRLNRIEEYAKRQAIVLRNAGVQILITSHTIEAMAKLLQPFIPKLNAVLGVAELMNRPGKLPTLIIKSEDPALIQYTSGSTGNPKGVLLSHGNLLANIRAIGIATQIKSTDITVSWLPLYHDMGLIGTWLGSLYFGLPITILSPLTFLAAPERWLWAIHTHQGTLSAAPNFAYELCVRKISDQALAGLDLSSWRLAFNGAEAINPSTIINFTRRFSKYGLREDALLPVYGLAESSVGLCIPPLGRSAIIDSITRVPFETERRAVPALLHDPYTLQFVSCGIPLPNHEIRIVDSNNVEIEERLEGNLQFRGPSTMQGYFNAPEATQAITHDGWLDSGDYAYKADGEIYITGRRKDIIIKAGRNLHPPEIEEIIGDIAGIRKGCVAVFGIPDPKLGTEKIVVVAESHEKARKTKETLSDTIIEQMVNLIGIPPDIIHITSPGTLLKTSSGKLRRSACREAYLQNKLIRHYKLAVWLQVAKLWLASITPRLKNYMQITSKYLYALYAYIILFITVLPTWLLLLLSPAKSKYPSKLTRCWAKIFLWLIGCSPTFLGKEHLTKDKTMILIANHSSYLDVIILIAALPLEFVFTAKQELVKTPFISTFIKKLNHLTVDRLNFAKGLIDTQIIENTLREGKSVLIFPEGTFTRARGLRPFKLGAFKAAVETDCPICPIVITGARQALRPDQWLPQPSTITVTALESQQPSAKEWHEIIRLRELARAEIAKYCGEPLLDLAFAGPE